VPGEARSRRLARRSDCGCPRVFVSLSFGLREPGVAKVSGEWLKRGLSCSK